MNFDRTFTQLLRSGDVASAKKLLLHKYPHLKTDSDRTALYITLYQNHYGKGIWGSRPKTKQGQNGGVVRENYP